MPQGPSPHRRNRVAALGLGFGLALSSLVVASPAGAETTRDGTRGDTRPADTRPVDERPDERPDDERPHRELEVLTLACAIADGAPTTDQATSDRAADVVADAAPDAAPDPTRVHIGCRWRAATSDRAAGYQLWRIVDRGERELVARGGLDLRGARDVVPSSASLVRYAVIAVDEHGRRVGQSRIERIVLDEDGARRLRQAHRTNIH